MKSILFFKKTALKLRIESIFKSNLILVWSILLMSSTTMAQKVTIKENNISISKVLELVKQQAGYTFLYDNQVDLSKKVSLSLENVSIEEALKICFKGLPVSYKIVEKTILLSHTDVEKGIDKKNETSKVASTSEVQLEGIVVDDAGSPLSGVSILVKESNKGVSTNTQGRFSISLEPVAHVIASYVGFNSFEWIVRKDTTVRIVLSRIESQMGAVVVTALGIKKATKALTYNVQEIGGEQVSANKGGNFVNELVGKVAGATINTSASGVGASARVVLRGTKSIDNFKNNALYVVDGVPLNNFNGAGSTLDIYSGANVTGDGISQMNPDDIASISVLTGPAAAALYGSSAAGGVILITTKKANSEKTTIRITNNTSFFSPFVLPRFQNSYGSSQGTYFSWGEKLETPSSYHPKDFFQTGLLVSNSVSLSTGSVKNQTYLSASSTNSKGIIPNNKLNRTNFTLRNTSNLWDNKLSLDLSAMFIEEDDQNMVSQGLYNNPLVGVYLFPPGDDIEKYQVYERYDASRKFKTQFWPFGDQGFAMQNPYWIINRDLNNHSNTRYVFNAGLKYTPLNWLTLAARARKDNANLVAERKYYASTSGIFAGANGYYSRYTTESSQTYADFIATGTFKKGDFLSTLIVGASYDDRRNNQSGYGGNLNSIPNKFIFANIASNDVNTLAIENIFHQQAQAVFSNLQLSFKNYLFLDASGRNDWNSALSGTAQQSIFYPSIGASFVVSDAFKLNVPSLSFFKLRASYSEVGSPPNPYVGTKPGYPFNGGSPITITDYPNKKLTPERTKSFEIGMNVKFFKNRLGLDITAYQSSTYNQIFYGRISSSSLYSGIYINGGQIDNKGIEAVLSYQANLGKVKWSSSATFTLNRNKIVKLLENYYDENSGKTFNIQSINLGGTSSYAQILKQGGQTGDIYVNTLQTDPHGYIRVDPRTREVFANDTAYIKAGSADPRYNIGFSNKLSYKNFSISLLATARVGGVGVSITQALMDRFGVSEASAQARDNGGVMINGGLIPAHPYYNVVGGGLTGIGAAYVYSATNIRLAQAMLSYELPIAKITKKIHSATLSVVGNNLFMFYNKAPFDPELTATTGTFYQGIDYFRAPSLRSVGFSVSMQF